MDHSFFRQNALTLTQGNTCVLNDRKKTRTYQSLYFLPIRVSSYHLESDIDVAFNPDRGRFDRFFYACPGSRWVFTQLSISFVPLIGIHDVKFSSCEFVLGIFNPHFSASQFVCTNAMISCNKWNNIVHCSIYTFCLIPIPPRRPIP